jgi:hypothetical protein
MPKQPGFWLPALYLGVVCVILPAYCIHKYRNINTHVEHTTYRSFALGDAQGMQKRKISPRNKVPDPSIPGSDKNRNGD